MSERILGSEQGDVVVSQLRQVGQASNTNVLIAGDPRISSVSAAAGKSVFEGGVQLGASGAWEGLDVLGSELGVWAATSGLIEEMIVMAVVPEGAFAAKIDELRASNEDAWQICDALEELVDNLNQNGAVLYAMSSYARVTEHYADNNISYDVLLDRTTIVLDGVYAALSVGQKVVVAVEESKFYARSIVGVEGATVTPVPGAVVPVTAITLSGGVEIKDLVSSQVRIWFNARKAGTLERIPTKTVTKSHILHIPRPVTLPPKSSLPAQDTDILIQDAEGTTLRAKGGGTLENNIPHILITEILDEDFSGELVKPITFLWGLTKVTRGQTVHREVIGSGDATQRWQSFRLAKSPLTYVADPFAPGGRRPEIEVFVNGVKWRRAQSFYKATPTDEIYVLRHDAEHQTFIQFGDGELGKRLPTGTNNVVATYRFGVGGNVEANTITKLVRPLKGVKSVYNPLPATGGEDPPTEQEARKKAIQSTRVLGKLVSLVDFEVEAAQYGGVLQAKAQQAWDRREDSAVVKVWIITADEGDPSADLRAYLMNMAEPGARVQVHKATKETRELTIDLELDPDYLPEEVQAAINARLFDEFEGLLAPRNARIGGVLYRSELYAAIHEIDGVLSVRGVLIFGSPMPRFLKAGEGGYLAFEYPGTG